MIANQLPLLEQIKAKLRHTRKRPSKNPSIPNYIFPSHQRPILPVRTNEFYQMLTTSLAKNQLDLALISDCPSKLSKGIIYLNYERMIALLEEQNLPLADLTELEFSAIINLIDSNAQKVTVISEQSILITGEGEKRTNYQIKLSNLLSPNQQRV